MQIPTVTFLYLLDWCSYSYLSSELSLLRFCRQNFTQSEKYFTEPITLVVMIIDALGSFASSLSTSVWWNLLLKVLTRLICSLTLPFRKKLKQLTSLLYSTEKSTCRPLMDQMHFAPSELTVQFHHLTTRFLKAVAMEINGSCRSSTRGERTFSARWTVAEMATAWSLSLGPWWPRYYPSNEHW